MSKTVLIAGASGRFGTQCALEFEKAGWTVRAFDRKSGDMSGAAHGVALIINALNPPNYQNWETEIPRITSEVIAAARSGGATILFPGNVYVYGDQPGPWSETTPHRANSRKGRVRANMEAAYKASGLRVINLRAGDFMDDAASGTWADLVMYKKLSKGQFVYPGNPNIQHAWGYLPDLARAAVMLADKRETLETYCEVCFPGYDATGKTYMQAVAKAMKSDLSLSSMPWFFLRLATPFWRLGRELLEMRYLWEHPHALDGAKFRSLLPDFTETPFEDAVAFGLPGDIQPH